MPRTRKEITKDIKKTKKDLKREQRFYNTCCMWQKKPHKYDATFNQMINAGPGQNSVYSKINKLKKDCGTRIRGFGEKLCGLEQEKAAAPKDPSVFSYLWLLIKFAIFSIKNKLGYKVSDPFHADKTTEGTQTNSYSQITGKTVQSNKKKSKFRPARRSGKRVENNHLKAIGDRMRVPTEKKSGLLINMDENGQYNNDLSNQTENNGTTSGIKPSLS